MRWTHVGRAVAIACTGLVLGACASTATGGAASSPAGVATSPPAHPPASPTSSGQSPLPSQSPVPAESNPPGDIPDTTVYVPYHSTSGGFGLKVPEGWARATKPQSVGFSSALNRITVTWMPSTAAPTVASATANEVPALRAGSLAFTLQGVKGVTLPGGPAVLITYQENSAPNPVTGKQYRLVIERFEFYRQGTQANLILSSAVGSDNVDPWRIVSESFRWR
jgi:hypothetical protein